MKVNIGLIDRILRIVLGTVLIVLAATGTIGWWGYLGIIFLLTGFIKFCPLYALFKINTASK